jgi:hypothetical protein
MNGAPGISASPAAASTSANFALNPDVVAALAARTHSTRQFQLPVPIAAPEPNQAIAPSPMPVQSDTGIMHVGQQAQGQFFPALVSGPVAQFQTKFQSPASLSLSSEIIDAPPSS